MFESILFRSLSSIIESNYRSSNDPLNCTFSPHHPASCAFCRLKLLFDAITQTSVGPLCQMETRRFWFWQFCNHFYITPPSRMMTRSTLDFVSLSPFFFGSRLTINVASNGTCQTATRKSLSTLAIGGWQAVPVRQATIRPPSYGCADSSVGRYYSTDFFAVRRPFPSSSAPYHPLYRLYSTGSQLVWFICDKWFDRKAVAKWNSWLQHFDSKNGHVDFFLQFLNQVIDFFFLLQKRHIPINHI